MPGVAVQGDAKRQQELSVAAAATGSTHSDRGLAARDEDTGRGGGLAEGMHLPWRDGRVHQSHVARFALDVVGENEGSDAGLARDFGGGLKRHLRCRDHHIGDACEARIAWFKVSPLGKPRCALTLPGMAMAYF